MMRFVKSVLLIWTIGVLITSGVTACLVYAAYQIRGDWAIGGEYAPVVLMIVICTWLTDSTRKKCMYDQEIAIHSIDKGKS